MAFLSPWLLDRFPLIVITGNALLGWIAGELAIHEPIAGVWMAGTIPWLHASLPYILCAAMMVIGFYVRRHRYGWA